MRLVGEIEGGFCEENIHICIVSNYIHIHTPINIYHNLIYFPYLHQRHHFEFRIGVARDVRTVHLLMQPKRRYHIESASTRVTFVRFHARWRRAFVHSVCIASTFHSSCWRRADFFGDGQIEWHCQLFTGLVNLINS